MKALFAVVLAVTLIASTGSVLAGQLTYTRDLPLSTTNWSNTISVPKFDANLGTLDRITFVLIGHVEGSASFESLEMVGANVTTNLSAKLTLMRPDYSPIVVSIPLASTTDSVGTFDGLIDFGGTSGKEYTGMSADRTETVTADAPSPDLALFIGSGDIVLPVSAVGNSVGTGAGNLIMQFSTLASAQAVVTYEYTSIPEPSSMLALLTGFVGLASWTFRRRAH